MENRFGAPASGTPEGSARREDELLLLLGGSRKATVQLWLRKQRIYANACLALTVAGEPLHARTRRGDTLVDLSRPAEKHATYVQTVAVPRLY